ncbi:AraC family transcriptional regulator [Pseudoalteromonas phenolica]|uniref:AraC family transcriptional regulator n=1 Tax=Pseudoalteromonas phenolica TaxID=161398 RepID=A0A5R9PWX3_9GAMM|nr:AraC family transcriptional regulator [Pseudoalteromonas phenolica]TLX45418.1 AraC family transcriptional regulator [Pseudoalteromonas phenolica]
MTLSNIYSIQLIVALTCLLAQLWVKNKHTTHILFAVFCGSVAMGVMQKLSADSFGAYQYLVGLGACATCNCYWLFVRSYFRGNNAIGVQHIALAIGIAVLIMMSKGYLFVTELWQIESNGLSFAKYTLTEITILLSSAIIVLSIWEALRGFNQASKTQQKQRVLYLCAIISAVLISKVAKGFFIDTPHIKESIIASITIFMLLVTQILMFWRFKSNSARNPANSLNTTQVSAFKPKLNETQIQASSLAIQTEEPQGIKLKDTIQRLLIGQKLYLQANLKVGDLAKQLDLPEYKVSRVIKEGFGARNFNHYINQLRVEHAKQLLSESDKSHWPVLVIGLESGFASVGPFTRAFKQFTGSTPNQYRQQFSPNKAQVA